MVAGRKLKAMDFGGKSDPFVQLKVKNRGTYKQTSTKQKTLNPEWKEEFELEVVDELNDKLDLSVYDWDKIGKNDLIGCLELPVAMVTSGPVDRWFTLCKKFQTDKPDKKLGEIHLKITYTDTDGKKVTGGAQPQQAQPQQPAPQQQQPHPMQAQAQYAQQQPQMSFQQAAQMQMAAQPVRCVRHASRSLSLTAASQMMMMPGPVRMQAQPQPGFMPGPVRMQQQYPGYPPQGQFPGQYPPPGA